MLPWHTSLESASESACREHSPQTTTEVEKGSVKTTVLYIGPFVNFHVKLGEHHLVVRDYHRPRQLGDLSRGPGIGSKMTVFQQASTLFLLGEVGGAAFAKKGLHAGHHS